MSNKIDVDVVIDGKQYTLSGAESSEYIQRIAAHINDKLAEFKKQDGYGGLESERKTVLLAINLADDYYKAKAQIAEMQTERQELEKEIFDMKHDLISMQSKLDQIQRESKALKEKTNEDVHSAIRMEERYEQASKNEEKSRLALTRLENRIKLVQDSEQRAQEMNKKLTKELEEQKELVAQLMLGQSKEATGAQEEGETPNADAEGGATVAPEEADKEAVKETDTTAVESQNPKPETAEDTDDASVPTPENTEEKVNEVADWLENEATLPPASQMIKQKGSHKKSSRSSRKKRR